MDILEVSEGIIQVMPEGRIDATNVQAFEETVLPQVKPPCRGIIVNLEKLEYISSAGLRAVLKLAKAAKAAQIKLVLCSLVPDVAEVFKISGFNLLLTIVPDLSAAQQSLS
ncbi:MAG: STAS domain-containing protein [Succinivibrio sp.]|nr:STAS domain-containing protein [Succinivibrio sp.]